ncbi:hypothetical protein Hanom_Chr11g01055361 [Helianthus anomalus]
MLEILLMIRIEAGLWQRLLVATNILCYLFVAKDRVIVPLRCV